jgi:hypothetical protein
VMDGFTLVNTQRFAHKVPVIVVSSVERQNSDLVAPLFKNGVRDFVEKPTFENFNLIGEELRQKLKMSWYAAQRNLHVKDLTEIKSPLKKARAPGLLILNAGISDREAVRETVKRHQAFEDTFRIIFSGPEHLWSEWAKDLIREFSKTKIIISPKTETALEHDGPTVLLQFRGGDTTLLNWGHSGNLYLILEEGQWPESVKKLFHDTFPVTSFSYMAAKHLEGV